MEPKVSVLGNVGQWHDGGCQVQSTTDKGSHQVIEAGGSNRAVNGSHSVFQLWVRAGLHCHRSSGFGQGRTFAGT